MHDTPHTVIAQNLHCFQDLTLFADRYEYSDPDDLLGSGVFGVVYRAWDHNQKHPVALKLLKKGTAPTRAYEEAQVLTKLRSDYVLFIHNAATADDIPYITTDVAPGGSAEDHLKEHPFGVAADRAIAWTQNALLGLASAHKSRIVHRDVKPGNIFLERPDWVLLGDFGVAGEMDDHGMVSSHGDTRICSPEMLSTGQGDLRSDIYSTGVTLYRLLSGRWPFEDPDPQALTAAVIAGACPPLRTVAPHIGQALGARVAKAMAVDPAARYQTAREMHEQLGRGPLVRRAWERIAPHPGHDCCWVEQAPMRGGTARFKACVSSTAGGRFELDCRRLTGLNKRVADHCRLDLTAAELDRRVRIMFRGLG